MPITKELKERWLERLRSPEAKWAGQKLYNPETGGMCCLGHLADIQGDLVLSGDGKLVVDEFGTEVDPEDGILNYIDASDIDDDGEHPIVQHSYGLTVEEMYDLAGRNDDDGRFPIDLIEALPVTEAEDLSS